MLGATSPRCRDDAEVVCYYCEKVRAELHQDRVVVEDRNGRHDYFHRRGHPLAQWMAAAAHRIVSDLMEEDDEELRYVIESRRSARERYEKMRTSRKTGKPKVKDLLA